MLSVFSYFYMLGGFFDQMNELNINVSELKNGFYHILIQGSDEKIGLSSFIKN